MLDLILRAKAATKLRTSTVALTEGEFRQYCYNVLSYNYPRLADLNLAVWSYLNMYSGHEEKPDLLDPYEWWLGTPVGPRACSRDIADLRAALRDWYNNHLDYGRRNDVVVSLGDEWDDTMELAIIRYQQHYPLYLLPTGYADMETLRRLRLRE